MTTVLQRLAFRTVDALKGMQVPPSKHDLVYLEVGDTYDTKDTLQTAERSMWCVPKIFFHDAETHSKNPVYLSEDGEFVAERTLYGSSNWCGDDEPLRHTLALIVPGQQWMMSVQLLGAMASMRRSCDR